MKKSQLRQIIREEISKVLKEDIKKTDRTNKEATKFYRNINKGDVVRYIGPEKNGFSSGEEYKVSHVTSDSSFNKTVVLKNGKKTIKVTGHSSIEPINENTDVLEREGVWFFHPSEETFSSRSRDYKVKTLQPWIFSERFSMKNRAQSATENTVMSVYDENEALRHQKKYGKPDEKIIKAFQQVEDAMWDLKRQTPARAYDEYSWYRFGNGSASDVGYVYSPENGFEFYLKIPREIRHPEEYSWVKDEDIEMFNNIIDGVHKIANKVESMGFKTSINSTPEGYTK